MNKQLRLTAIALLTLTVPMLSASAGEKPFPKRVPVLDGSYHEGFAIGKGSIAYSGSPDGSVYKVNLRNGEGEVLIPPVAPFDPINDCYTLGMRVDPRSNNLFVAGCFHGNAYVYDADSGEELKNYQLAPQFQSVINDLAITQDAVYFTDFAQPFIYRLPLTKNGRIPDAQDAAVAIPLTGDFVDEDENVYGAYANGIVATPDGETLIVGNSGTSKIFRVDPTTGYADEIIVDPPLVGFLDGIIMRDGVLYIVTPDGTFACPAEDRIQVVVLDDDMLTGTQVGIITDPENMEGVASGALHGDSLYVNNARYCDFPQPDTEYWITKLNIYDVEPVD